VLHVVFYRSSDDVAQRAGEHYPAHVARCQEFTARGTLLAYGTFGDPRAEGSMAIFTTRAAAEEFVAGDPFVLKGVVAGHEIREWNASRAADAHRVTVRRDAGG
jgi:uncharacterized protein